MTQIRHFSFSHSALSPLPLRKLHLALITQKKNNLITINSYSRSAVSYNFISCNDGFFIVYNCLTLLILGFQVHFSIRGRHNVSADYETHIKAKVFVQTKYPITAVKGAAPLSGSIKDFTFFVEKKIVKKGRMRPFL